MDGEVRDGVGRGADGGWMRVSLVGFLVVLLGMATC